MKRLLLIAVLVLIPKPVWGQTNTNEGGSHVSQTAVHQEINIDKSRDGDDERRVVTRLVAPTSQKNPSPRRLPTTGADPLLSGSLGLALIGLGRVLKRG